MLSQQDVTVFYKAPRDVKDCLAFLVFECPHQYSLSDVLCCIKVKHIFSAQCALLCLIVHFADITYRLGG